MGRQKLEIVLHHSITEVEEKMNKSKGAIEYKHWLIIKLLIEAKEQKTPEEAAE